MDDKLIVAAKPHKLWDYLEIVLCKVDNEHTPYVTWLHNHTDNGYYQGSYHTNILDAAKDFEERNA